MRIRFIFALALLASWAVVPVVEAQDAAPDLKEAFLTRYNYAAYRLVQLAEAMPEDKFAWSPGEGVMSVERVFMHIIRYNYYYPASSLGIAAPDGLDGEHVEMRTGKATVLNHLQASLDHVRDLAEPMSEADLNRRVTLYGRETAAWNVLHQLQVHMGEHLGQLIAYARMNDVVPPWSR